MKVIVELDISDLSMKKEKKTLTTHAIAKRVIKDIPNRDNRIKGTRFVSLIDDQGQPFHELSIDMLGVLRVVGGYTFIDSTNHQYNMVVVDEGASYLIFELRGNKALFYGALSGLELERFERTSSGECFHYYKRTYRKLSMKAIEDIIDPDAVYRHEPGEALESARKGTRKGTLQMTRAVPASHLWI